MPATTPLIAAWARSAVVPRGGAFKALQAHEIAAPVIQALLHKAGLDAGHVNTVIAGNALGAGGNPARMAALHAGLPDTCTALTIDTQCCAGLDAVRIAAALITAGQADVVIAGGVEAWSRAPIRMHRPLQPNDTAIAYERPAFAPAPHPDPDMLEAAAHHAAAMGYTRAQQDHYAQRSHHKARANLDRQDIVPILGICHDAYPRALSDALAARMPLAVEGSSLSTLAISPQADGAAFVLLVSPKAAAQWQLPAPATWVTGSAVGASPACPLLAAEIAARAALQQAHLLDPVHALSHIELHDAFAAQGLSFCQGLGLDTENINPLGGGLARGHPIGASGAIALVQLLHNLSHQGSSGAYGLAAIAGAGGLGAAAVVRKA